MTTNISLDFFARGLSGKRMLFRSFAGHIVKAHMHAKLIVLFALLAAPVWAANPQVAQRAYEQGLRAESAGNYSGARDAFKKALTEAQEAGLGQDFISAATYNLGRMTGYTCDFARAKELLLEALRLEQALPAPSRANVTKRLSELARLSYDQGAFSESVSYYDLVVPELEELGVLKLDPNGFAIFLDDYAQAHARSGDEHRADAARRKAADIRFTNVGVPVRFRPTYYRDVCASK
jgi:tetratricopeptide (TPR) repeat protein